MTLPDGYSELAPGKIASVVTYLEMREPPAPKPVTAPPGVSVRKITKPDLMWYRQLYRTVGENWLWFRRLRMRDDELASIIHSPLVDVYALSVATDSAATSDKGLLELDRREASEIEIAYLGLTADMVGRGAGKYLMAKALAAAWATNPSRIWVHTCTLDHPNALAFYTNVGFTPYKRAVEVAEDPRLTGDTPRTAAPHVPIFGQ